MENEPKTFVGIKLKHLAIAFVCLFIANTAITGLPPTTMQGLWDTVKTTTFNFFAPNYQVTTVTGGRVIETGNKNILKNPSFEHKTFDTGWTFSGVQMDPETSIVIDGKKSASIPLAASNFELTQDSTLYASQFADGVQCLAMVRVKTNIANTKICSRQAGVTSTTNCVTASTDNKWGLYKVPFICGATSNGISIASASTVGQAYVDDAFVGAVDLKTDSVQIQTQTTKFVAGSTGQGVIFFGTPTTVGSANYSYVAGTGIFTALRDINLNISCTGTNSTTVSTTPTIYVNGANTGQQASSPATANFLATTSWTGIVPSGQTFYCLNQNSTASAGTVNVMATNTVNSQIYSAQNANTDWSPCNFSTLAWQGLGTVTNNLICRRDGPDLLVGGYFTVGTVSGSLGQLNLPLWNGTQLNTRSQAYYGGRILRNVATSGVKDFAAFSSAQQSFLNISYPENTLSVSPLSARAGNDLFNSSEVVSVESRIPIQGWENSSTITGSFAEVMTVPNVSKPKTCYYAFGGASATLAAPTECTTGTCTEVYDSCGTGTPPAWATVSEYNNLTFANGTFANSTPVHCECVAYDTTLGQERQCTSFLASGDNTWSSTSSGGYVGNLFTTNNAGVAGTAYIQVKCEGQAP